MSCTSKLLLGVLASMMVCCWPLIGADELDPTKQEDHAGFGPAARQVMAATPRRSVAPPPRRVASSSTSECSVHCSTKAMTSAIFLVCVCTLQSQRAVYSSTIVL